MFASASLLYNKLRGGNRNRGVNRGFIFQTTFRHRGGYYATNSQTKNIYFDSAFGKNQADFHRT